MFLQELDSDLRRALVGAGALPLTHIMERLAAPPFRPIRKVVPLVGGIDLSPLVLLQIAAIALGAVQQGVMR